MSKVKVTKQSSTGRNLSFKDTSNNRYMDRKTFVKSIENGNYDSYHVRVINGLKTPVSNPDKSSKNNLG